MSCDGWALFLAVPQGCLRFVIVAFPDHTNLLFAILVLTAHGQTHCLIPHADAVELAFVFIYIFEQQMLWYVFWHIFTGLHDSPLLDIG